MIDKVFSSPSLASRLRLEPIVALFSSKFFHLSLHMRVGVRNCTQMHVWRNERDFLFFGYTRFTRLAHKIKKFGDRGSRLSHPSPRNYCLFIWTEHNNHGHRSNTPPFLTTARALARLSTNGCEITVVMGYSIQAFETIQRCFSASPSRQWQERRFSRKRSQVTEAFCHNHSKEGRRTNK